VELARFGVTVNAVCPGPIQTEMLGPLMQDERYREKMLKGIPMRRLGVPEDVAGAVAFFASEESAFITGNVLVIDGGMTVKAL
jgi:NAD(P)-dependent dehydrogenase (short-subunit alcohol dehydrogenase family)